MSVFGGNDVQLIALEDGKAEPMGDGIFAVIQRDGTAPGVAHNVVLSANDLEALRNEAGGALTIDMEDGTAYRMDFGLFAVTQRDQTLPGAPMQSVILTSQDLEAMLAAA